MNKMRHYLARIYHLLEKNFTTKKKIKGNGNSIISKAMISKNVKITVCGRNNKIVIDEECILRNVKITVFGNNNNLVLNKKVEFYAGGEISLFNSNTKITIGENSKFYYGGQKIETAEDNSEIYIGRDCLFSNDIIMTTSDSHSVLDLSTNQRVNKARNIYIGDKVWVGRSVTIMKGTSIEHDSVVGTHAVVTKKFDEPNVVIAGNPAKIVKHNVSWDKELR